MTMKSLATVDTMKEKGGAKKGSKRDKGRDDSASLSPVNPFFSLPPLLLFAVQTMFLSNGGSTIRSLLLGTSVPFLSSESVVVGTLLLVLAAAAVARWGSALRHRPELARVLFTVAVVLEALQRGRAMLGHGAAVRASGLPSSGAFVVLVLASIGGHLLRHLVAPLLRLQPPAHLELATPTARGLQSGLLYSVIVFFLETEVATHLVALLSLYLALAAARGNSNPPLINILWSLVSRW
jgi:hypothetical protein